MKDKTRLERQTSGTEEIFPGGGAWYTQKKGNYWQSRDTKSGKFWRKCFGAITGYVQRKSFSHVTEWKRVAEIALRVESLES